MRQSFILIAGIALAVVPALPASAHPVVLAKAKSAKGGPGPTEISKKIKLSPDGLKFGMSVEEISKLYDKVFDEEFVPLYQSVEPGPRMTELDSELAEKKKVILRNKLEFGSLPSGLDNTPFAGEYSYKNGESLTHVKLRSGVERYFFFFGDSMWKVYDVHTLGPKDKLGADYDAALQTLTKQLGKAPRVRKADPASGVRLDQADWEDKDTIVRFTNRGDGTGALSYIQRKVEENIDHYRPTKAGGGEGVDATVSEVTKQQTAEDPKAKSKQKK